MCGLRSTVYRSMRVGIGIGPHTRALVRLALIDDFLRRRIQRPVVVRFHSNSNPMTVHKRFLMLLFRQLSAVKTVKKTPAERADAIPHLAEPSERGNLAIIKTLSRCVMFENTVICAFILRSTSLASQKRHHGERSPVRLVVIPHRVIPPRSVRFLVRQDRFQQLLGESSAIWRDSAARANGRRNNDRNSSNSRKSDTTIRAETDVCDPCPGTCAP